MTSATAEITAPGTPHPGPSRPDAPHRRQPADALQTAYHLRAMGRKGLPRSFELNGKTYRLARDVKHDFFAATGFYDADDGSRVVLKAGRENDFFGLPLWWLGRYLRDREVRIYSKLRDIPNVPRVLGTVGRTCFVLQFIPSRPLVNGEVVPDGFFRKLHSIIQTVHSRGLAYVDMNKKANILIGDDDQPYLVDFQISYDLDEFGHNPISRRILRWLQQEDLYHVRKHHNRFRPDELTDEERAAAERKSLLIRIHRVLTKPYFRFRRRTFKRLRESGRILPEGSE